jgi:hypothetical protein
MKKWGIIAGVSAAAVAAILFMAMPLDASNPEQGVWGQRVDAAFAPSDCQPATVQRFGYLYYDGPLIDTHFHIAGIPDSPLGDFETGDFPVLGANVRMTDIACALEQEGITKAFAFFPVYKQIPAPMVKVAERTMELYPDRFVPFIMPPDSDNLPGGSPTVDAQVLQEMLAIQPGLFEGYGEIGLYERQGGAAELPPDSQRLQEIYPVAREHGLTVYFHLGEGQKDEFERVLLEYWNKSIARLTATETITANSAFLLAFCPCKQLA